MAIVIIIRVVELHKHKVCRTAMCSSRFMFFTVTVCSWSWRETDIFPFIYLLDIAKVNFSVIILNSGFRAPDSGFRIPDSGFRIPDSGFRIPDFGFRFLDFGFRIPDSGFRIPDSGFRIPDSGFRFPDSGFRIPAFRVAQFLMLCILAYSRNKSLIKTTKNK